MLGYGVEYTICEGKGKGVYNGHCVELPIVDTNTNLLVLFGYNHDGNQPGCQPYRSYEPNLQDFIDFFFGVSHLIRVHAVPPLLYELGIVARLIWS